MSWILYGVALSGLLTLAAWGLERGLAALGSPTRWVWALALAGSVGSLGLAASGALPPGSGAQATAGEGVAAVEPLGEAGDQPAAGAGVRALAREVVGVIPTFLASTVNHVASTLHRGLGRAVLGGEPPPEAGRAFLAFWLLASLTFLTGAAAAQRRLRRRLARWPSARVLGHELLLSDDVGPAVVGVSRPQLVLPKRLLTLDQPRLGMILLHEEEHRRAGDTRLLTAGLLALIMVPWNPFLWLQHRRLRQALEADCDARVLRRGVSRRAYAWTLLSVCTDRPLGPLPALTLSAPARHLKRRIRAMKPRSPLSRIPTALAGVLLALTVLLAACQVDVPTADTLPLPTEAESSATVAEETVAGTDGSAPDAGATPPLRTSDIALRAGAADPESPSPLIVVDGDVWSEDLSEIDPVDIARVEVFKGEAALTHWGEAGAHGVIRITTKEAEANP